jgi:hypothetical protein
MWAPGSRRRKDEAGDAPGVSLDCERVLDGSYLDWVCAGGGPVPCWAWLNKLTHCARSELSLIAARPLAMQNRPELHSWARTVSFLALELARSSARSGRDIADLQHEALLPLEVELMGATFGPSELTRRVLGAIDETTRHSA